MEIAYYDLSGGINQASTKTELGLNTKKVYWADSENIEILENKGICKQKGNTLFLTLPVEEAVTGMHEVEGRLIITTYSGKIYLYDNLSQTTELVDKTLVGKSPLFANFLGGTVISTESDEPFYLASDLTTETCMSSHILANAIAVFKGRVWIASGSTLYFSALGTYNDFETSHDAGYISDFHTDTDDIIAIKSYKNYLAIYKRDRVYLLTGTTPEDFAVIPFADKGCLSARSIVNVENKQYFLNQGIFALEQVGELNQIQLGSEISLKIKPEFSKFTPTSLKNSFCVHYERKNQVWFFFPYSNNQYFNTVWINDYVNKAWYKRIIPQNITTACIFDYNILTADDSGHIYKEDNGNDFCGLPVKFMWKSPFFAIGSAHHRKMIDEFYFIIDESFDNHFDFTVYKDYDSEHSDDPETIYSVHLEHMIWADDATSDNTPCHWALDDDQIPIWSVNTNTLEKAEISEANYSIQLCITGREINESCAIIGLQFREIYNDD